MQSVVIDLAGNYDRSRLEAVLSDQIREQALIRVKGQLVQPDRTHPLQIQAVGPRIECWYERRSSHQQETVTETPMPGLRLVALGLQVKAERLEQALALALVP